MFIYCSKLYIFLDQLILTDFNQKRYGQMFQIRNLKSYVHANYVTYFEISNAASSTLFDINNSFNERFPCISYKNTLGQHDEIDRQLSHDSASIATDAKVWGQKQVSSIFSRRSSFFAILGTQCMCKQKSSNNLL